MQEPTLVVMAAGMGSRYGGLKQIDPVGPRGEIIIDYSLFDAMEAGFSKVVFIINERIKDDFIEAIGSRVSRHMDVKYVYQAIESRLPAGYAPPDVRKKPWGTAHAILCCKDAVDGPFGAINADDYYGKEAYRLLYNRLKNARDGEKYDYCMVGYILDNTLTDNGSVARGVCAVDEKGRLTDIVEHLRIIRTPEGAADADENGKPIAGIPAHSLVSMNFFGFTPSIFDEIERQFPVFLENTVPGNPEKAEFYIPNETGRLLRAGKCEVTVMPTHDKWFGVTYKADKPGVMESLARMTETGLYPDHKLF